jgi:dipeptidase
MMGESTCAANLVSWPRPVGYALFDVAALTRLAMERCATAVCAIKTMGAAAEEHGYYGMADPLGAGEALYWESGEAITIIDRQEAWIFHILPDDTVILFILDPVIIITDLHARV